MFTNQTFSKKNSSRKPVPSNFSKIKPQPNYLYISRGRSLDRRNSQHSELDIADRLVRIIKIVKVVQDTIPIEITIPFLVAHIRIIKTDIIRKNDHEILQTAVTVLFKQPKWNYSNNRSRSYSKNRLFNKNYNNRPRKNSSARIDSYQSRSRKFCPSAHRNT